MAGELRISITGAERIVQHFEAAISKFKDMRPLMLRLRDQLYKDYEVVWDKGQEEWAEWSPAYAKWRNTGSLGGGTSERTTRLDFYAAGRGMQSIGDHPFGEMLDLTGRLRESLTSDDPDNIAILNRQSITFGTKVSYASYVNDGGEVRGKYGPPKKSSWGGGEDPFRLPRDFSSRDKFDEGMRRRWRRIVEQYAKQVLD